MKYSKHPKGLKYNLYLYHNNVFIGKYGLFYNDIEKLTKEYTQEILIDAFKKGLSIKEQIIILNKFCDKIAQMKFDCYRVRMSDLILFMRTALCLFRYNEKSWNDFIILKIKNKNKKYKRVIDPY
jgi:hypothetical protein